jgi:hypothetical protein
VRRRIAASFCALCIFSTAIGAATAQSRDPAYPPGLDPGGVAVAVFPEAIDYTAPEIMRRLARDGEGDVIAWDFLDNDPRPYGPTDPRVVDLLAMSDAIRLVVGRQAAADPARAARLTAFAVRTPARIVLVWDTAPNQPDWRLFFEGVTRFPDRLFVVPRWPNAAYDSVSGLANLIVAAPRGAGKQGDVEITVAAGQDETRAMTAASYAATLAAIALRGEPNLSAADLKARVQQQCARQCTVPTATQPR